MRKIILVVLFLLAATPSAFSQALDVFGGRMDSACSGHPHVVAFTGASQSGTSATIPLSNTSGWVVNEPVIVIGTGTALDSSATGATPGGNLPKISAISANVSLTLTTTSSNTVSGAAGSIEPAFWYDGTVTSGPVAGSKLECTPLDHWKFIQALSEFQPITNGISGGLTAAQTKYGVTGSCAVIQALLPEFAAWNWNTIGEDSESDTSPTGTCSSNTGMLPNLAGTDNVSLYAMDNLDGHAPQAPLDLTDIYSPQMTTHIGYVRANAEGFPDTFSPSWTTFITGWEGIQNQITSPFTVTYLRDDTDGVACTGAGPDFTSTNKSTNCDISYVIAVGSPVSTLSADNLYGANWPQVYADPKNYTKTSSNYNPYGNSTTSTPPSSCSYTGTRCSLQDYLCGNAGSLYSTVAALNTAWGLATGYYDTCGSDGTAVTAAPLGTGDGTTTTFSATLHTNVDPHSVLILVSGTAIGGDCPAFAKKCVASVGTGALLSAYNAPAGDAISSGTITYATGAISVAFTTAPASGASITVDYIWGGWPRGGPGGGGHGLMDEDGTTTSAIGSNGYCMVASVVYPGTCADGDQIVPNAQAQAGANLENWVPQVAAQYACTLKTTIEAVSGVGTPSWGLNVTGSWGAPAARGWYQGESLCTTGLFTDEVSMSRQTDAAARFNFVAQYSSVPTFGEGFTASTQGTGGCSASDNCFSTEAGKGAAWYNSLVMLLTPVGYNGKYIVGGATWWSAYRCLSGCGGDLSDYGIKTGNDNAYDGSEDVATVVACSSPLGAYTCGSEPTGAWNGTDAIGTSSNGLIRNANLLWLNLSANSPARRRTRRSLIW